MAGLDLSFIPALYTPSALLPIARHKASLLYTIETTPVTVLIGQTGSGKTTQLPQFLEQAGWCSSAKCIAVTQVSRSMVWGPSNLTIYLAPKSGCDHCRNEGRRGDAMSSR